MSRSASVYENERLHKRQWAAAGPLPPHWSNADGTEAVDHDVMAAPEGWRWAANWSIDYSGGGTDRYGFEYATSYVRFGLAGRPKRRKQKWSDRYRRRRWVRRMERKEPGETQQHDGGGGMMMAGVLPSDDDFGGGGGVAGTSRLGQPRAAAPPAVPAGPGNPFGAPGESGDGGEVEPSPPPLPSMTREQVQRGMLLLTRSVSTLSKHTALIGGERDAPSVRAALRHARRTLKQRIEAADSTLARLQKDQEQCEVAGLSSSASSAAAAEVQPGESFGSPSRAGERGEAVQTYSRAEWNKLRREMAKLRQRFLRVDREAELVERQFPCFADGSPANEDDQLAGAAPPPIRGRGGGGHGRMRSGSSSDALNSMLEHGGAAAAGGMGRRSATMLESSAMGQSASRKKPAACPRFGPTGVAETTARGCLISREDAAEQLLAHMTVESHQEVNEKLIAERGVLIEEVAESMNTINQMFKDFAMHVDEQQEFIDVLESQMEGTHIRVKAGVADITHAHDEMKECCIQ